MKNDAETGGLIFNALTVRDYFASALLAGWMANPKTIRGCDDYGSMVHQSYIVADLMLVEREK